MSIEASFSKILEFGSGGCKNKQITDTIAELIYPDNRLFSVIEGEGFKKLIKLLAPLYKSQCCKTITGLLTENTRRKKLAVKAKNLRAVWGLTIHYS